jgi:hypothetical protein
MRRLQRKFHVTRENVTYGVTLQLKSIEKHTLISNHHKITTSALHKTLNNKQ